MKGLNHERPILAKIFVIPEITIETLFACVLVHEALEVTLLNSLFFQQAHLWPLKKQ